MNNKPSKQTRIFTLLTLITALLITSSPVIAASSAEPCPYEIIGDLNDDCKVDMADLAQMVANWMLDCHSDPTDSACVAKETPITPGFYAISDHVVFDFTQTWLSIRNERAGSTIAGVTLKIQFTDSSAIRDEAIVTVELSSDFDDVDFTLLDIVYAINAVSLNLPVAGDGTVQAYPMASVHHDSVTGKYSLKLSSRTETADNVTITLSTDASITATGGFVVIAAQTHIDITEPQGLNYTDDGRMVKAR